MTRSFRAAFAALLTIGILGAWTGGPPVSYTFVPSPNDMQVEGGSTIHDWSCPITSLQGTLALDTAATDDSSIGALSDVRVQVPVDSIKCDNGTMNEKLREALEMNAHPKVSFSLQDAQVSPLPDSGETWFQVDATGELTLAGEPRQITLPVAGQRLDNGNLRFVGRHTIRLSDYDVKRPSAMFGAIKVSKEVTVHFDVTARPSAQ